MLSSPSARPAVAEREESGWGAWRRRSLTVPAYALGWALVVVGAPVWIALAAIVDLARAIGGQPRAPTLRAYAFVCAYLTCEVVGITVAGILWVTRLVTRADERRFIDWHFRLQCLWTRALFGAAVRLYGLRVEVEGADRIGSGPMLVFMRHTSVADTVLPGVYIQGLRGISLRYVMKRELLADPCLDIVGHRLRNHFVRRDASTIDDQARQIAAVGALADDLVGNEGVLIYPEGTRFSVGRREKTLARMRAANDAYLERASRLEHVLPPRLGGALALLAHEDLDVVFCAHTGFEGAVTLPAFFAGELIGRRICVGFWREPASARRADHAAWLYEAWARVDAWIGAHS